MINYRKIERIASQLEKQLGIKNEIDERTEVEKEEISTPTPSVEASDLNVNIEEFNFDGDLDFELENDEDDDINDEIDEVDEEINKIEEKELKASRIAKIQRLIKLAKAVKKSNKLSAEEKKEALKEIEKASKKNANKNLKIKKDDLNKLLSGDVSRIMKQTTKLNDTIKDNRRITLNQAIKEMKKWGRENNVSVDFPENILNKTVGSCDASWLIKLGPMIANLLNKYEELKNDDEQDED